MRHGSYDLIPNRYTVPGDPANRPDEKSTLDERLRQRKKLNRVAMTGDVFRRHYGHEKGEDDRLGPYTGTRT